MLLFPCLCLSAVDQAHIPQSRRDGHRGTDHPNHVSIRFFPLKDLMSPWARCCMKDLYRLKCLWSQYPLRYLYHLVPLSRLRSSHRYCRLRSSHRYTSLDRHRHPQLHNSHSGWLVLSMYNAMQNRQCSKCQYHIPNVSLALNICSILSSIRLTLSLYTRTVIIIYHNHTFNVIILLVLLCRRATSSKQTAEPTPTIFIVFHFFNVRCTPIWLLLFYAFLRCANIKFSWDFNSVPHVCNELFVKSGISNVLIYSVGIGVEYSCTFFNQFDSKSFNSTELSSKSSFVVIICELTSTNSSSSPKKCGASQSLRLLSQSSSSKQSVCIFFILTPIDCFPVFHDQLGLFWKSKVIKCWTYWLFFSLRGRSGENGLKWANINKWKEEVEYMELIILQHVVPKFESHAQDQY